MLDKLPRRAPPLEHFERGATSSAPQVKTGFMRVSFAKRAIRGAVPQPRREDGSSWNEPDPGDGAPGTIHGGGMKPAGIGGDPYGIAGYPAEYPCRIIAAAFIAAAFIAASSDPPGAPAFPTAPGGGPNPPAAPAAPM